MDINCWGRKILPSFKQATLPPLILPIGSGAKKNELSVTRSTDSVHVGVLTPHGYNRFGPIRSVLGLHPGKVGQDIPVEVNSVMVPTFINQFVKVHSNYPATDFRVPGWVHPAQKP